MSEHGHGGAPAKAESAFGSVSPAVWVFIGIALVVILWQGYNVVSSSWEQHRWPAANATKVDLPAAKL